MHDYNLPGLPDGYRWYIKDSFGSPYLCLQKRARFNWSTVIEEYVVLWHSGDYADRVRQTAHSIMSKDEARRMRLRLGEVK